MEKVITYFGQSAKIACDEKCHKAWGILNRPKIQLSEDKEDIAYLSDEELDIAPVNPGTYEGGDAKPTFKTEIPNKWCVRECEKCYLSNPGESHLPVKLKDWSKRLYNQPGKH